MNRLISNETAVDDVALLAVMRTAVDADTTLHVVEPAVPQALHSVRLAVRGYLQARDATPADVADVVLAVGEAWANVVEHAYGPGGGTMEVLAELVGPDLTVTVVDTGTWREPRGVNRGRGTPMMHALVDDVRILQGPAGTRVVMRRTLGRGPDAGGA